MRERPTSSQEHPAGGQRDGASGTARSMARDDPTAADPVLQRGIASVAETFPFLAWVKDLDGRFLAATHSFADAVGLPGAEALVGKTDTDIWPADLAERYRADDRAVIDTGTARMVEETIELHGARVWFESFKAPLKAADGRVVGTYGFTREITARKRAHDLLEVQRDLGLALVEAPDEERAYAALLGHAVRLPDVQAVGVYAARPDGAYELRGHQGFSETFLARVRVMPAALEEIRAVRAGQTLRSWEGFGPDLLEVLRAEGLRAVAVLPIGRSGEVQGALNLASRTRDRIEDEVVLALEAMCAHVAHVLQRLRAQRSLQESEARWEFALEGAGDGVWDWDVRSGRVFYSRRWKEMLGYEEAEIGDSLDEWASRVHPDDRGSVESQPHLHYRGETSHFATEHRLRRKDGSYTWVFDRGRVIEREPDGRPRRVIGIQSDISDRKRTEAALRDGAELLRDVITSISDGTLVEDGHGHVLVANERFAELWRVPAELMAARDENAIRAWALDELEDPEGFSARVDELSGTDVDCVDLVTFKDGRCFERHSGPLMREGRVAGRVWSFRDVTETRRQELLFRSLVAATPDAFVALDSELRIVDWSPQAERLFGWTAKDAIGACATGMVLPEPDAARLQAGLAEFARTGRSREIGRVRRQTVLHRDGRAFPAEIQFGASRVGGAWRFSCFARDITQRLLADERLAQAEKIEAIGQLTGGLAHDFNNILGIVIGNLDLMATAPAHEWPELLEAARKAADRGAEVTRALLAIARRQELSPGSVDLNTLVGDLLPLLAQTAGKRVSLSFQGAPGPAVSHVDPGGFNNAMLNLVLNARDAMPEGGGVHIRIEAVTLGADAPAPLEEGRYNLVEVRDTGSGMSPEVAARVFDPFFTTKGRGKGTGLGLAMVYGFARQSGGTVVVQSLVGRGSTFQMYLPVLAEGSAPEGDAGGKPAEARGDERVLIVDDEPSLLKVASRWLVELGYDVTAVASPAEALVLLGQDRFDVLVSDVLMPGQMDGVDLASAAERLDPGMAILLISGYPEGLVEKIQGRWRLLDKPFSRDQIGQMIRATLAGHAAR